MAGLDGRRAGRRRGAKRHDTARGGPGRRLLADGLLVEAAEHGERVALESTQRRDLAALDRPTYELPALPGGIDLGALYELADAAERTGDGVTPPTRHAEPGLDVDALLDDPATRVIVCCGAGGVGKTTTAAALALRAAERGRRVVVLTIDPARRLAQSMGLAGAGQHPPPGGQGSTRPTAAASTR